MNQIFSRELNIPTCVEQFLQKLIMEEYLAQMPNPGIKNRVTAYFDGQSYWAAGSLEYLKAAQKFDLKIEIELIPGDQRDAILQYMKSVIANNHSIKQSRQFAALLLEDAQWNAWTNEEIAQFCNLTSRQVNRIRTQNLSKVRQP